MQNVTESRLPHLDAVRALAALMGIIIHTAAGYLAYPIPQWPRFGSQSCIFFDYFAGAIHMFRVPVFFFLAGFFSYSLLQKSSFWGFTKNRFKRILLPFLFFSLLLNLPLIVNKLFLHQFHSVKDIYFIFQNLSYLWFLEYLLIYYFIYLMTHLALKFLKINTNFVDASICRWTESFWRAIPIVLLNIFLLYLIQNVFFTPIFLSFIPNIWLLSVYAIYFSLGIILAKHKRLESFFVFKWQYLIMGIFFYIAYLFLMLSKYNLQNLRIGILFLYCISSYLFFSSFIALCSAYLKKQNKIFRFLADASYWIYLSQIFFIFLAYRISVIMVNSIFLQFTITCIIAVLLSLVTYIIFRIPKNSVKELPPLQSDGGLGC